ncbi:hypothetical protein Vretimale_7371 [Volvox reticuliferus]|uniref:Uncharacterized protein n=1 Tax=Volvox reticuliferus TaxID=1737510 RepID=A0A8J4LMK7_9CHLO|nr:hypothetical protein Vretimale_7371 [Volvox reticuliferus]
MSLLLCGGIGLVIWSGDLVTLREVGMFFCVNLAGRAPPPAFSVLVMEKGGWAANPACVYVCMYTHPLLPSIMPVCAAAVVVAAVIEGLDRWRPPAHERHHYHDAETGVAQGRC